MHIHYFKPTITGQEIKYITKIIEEGQISSGGAFTLKVKEQLSSILKNDKVLATTSCTHSLEMAIQLLNIDAGDEVLMPSYTFPSTANAVLLRGGIPILVDVDPLTLQIDINSIPEKITERTKAILVVHYGGSSCNMDQLMAIANKYQLYVIEDAAQSLGATYKGQPLGTIGHIGCFSFHSTKNVGCGEGGALSINCADSIYKKALVIRDKGTDRHQYIEGHVDYYQWVDKGSSYVPSEILMAYLYAQLSHRDVIQRRRGVIFREYEELMRSIEDQRILSYSSRIEWNEHSYHLFFIQFKLREDAKDFMQALKDKGIETATHFVSLHQSAMGRKLGYSDENFLHSNHLGERVVRLPLYPDLKDEEIAYIKECIQSYFHEGAKKCG